MVNVDYQIDKALDVSMREFGSSSKDCSRHFYRLEIPLNIKEKVRGDPAFIHCSLLLTVDAV